MILHKVGLTDFKNMAEQAHLICFNEIRPAGKNTFDFALFVESDEHLPMAYATCIEMDKGTLYMQHGGAFPQSHGVGAVRAYHKIMNFVREGYERASTIIKGDNIPMLKMALSQGFVPHGADVMSDGFFIHLLNDFRKVK